MSDQRQVLSRQADDGFLSEGWLFTYRVDLADEPTLEEVSPSLEQTLGIAPDRLRGTSDFAFVHPDDRRRFESFLADPPARSCKEIFRLAGESDAGRHGRHTFRPTLEDGEVVHLEAVVYEQPADWELPFDVIVDAVNEGILLLRFDGEILYANHRTAEILGYHPEEMIGTELFEFMSEDWANRARENLERRRQGVEEVFDHQLVRKDGSTVWATVATKPMDEAMGFEGSLVAIQAISDRKEMEEKLQAARDELEACVDERTRQLREANEQLKREVRERREAEQRALQASRAKSAFLANVSHELRTPLNAIIGYSELVRENLERAIERGESVGDGRPLDDLERIHRAGEHLMELIEDVLDVSTAEAGDATVEREPFEMLALVDEVAETMRSVVRENDNELTTEVGELGEVTTDRTKVKQILINLVGNAAKFTREGSIRVSVTPATYDGVAAARIEVADTGVGIAAEKLDELFEPFVQAENAELDGDDGTGLGLTICKRYAEMLGGKIGADSEPGEGATFHVVIPTDD